MPMHLQNALSFDEQNQMYYTQSNEKASCIASIPRKAV